jgi:hypothetical protein
MRPGVGLLVVIVLLGSACGGAVSARPPKSTPAGALATPLTSPTPGPEDPCRHAGTPTSVVLPVTSFGRVLGDPTNCYVYVSSPASDAVVVVDYSGNVVKTIKDEYGAGAMVINDSSLYVALTTTGAIDEIDTATLTRVKTVASGLVKPRDLAFAAGRLWTTSGDCRQLTMKLASVDPANGNLTFFDPDRSTNLGYCTSFASDAKPGKLLVAWDTGVSPGSVTVMDVSTGHPVVVTSSREEIFGNLMDTAVAPGGDRFVTASGVPDKFDEWRLSATSRDGIVYPSMPHPNSVAISPVRDGLLVTGVSGSNGDVVAEYELGKPKAVATMLDTGVDDNLLYPRGLAFSRDGAQIFAVTGFAVDGSGSIVRLNVLPGPSLP